MTPAQLEALNRADRAALDLLSRTTGRAVAALWTTIVNAADDATAAAYVARAIGAVSSGQRIAASMAATSVRRSLRLSDGVSGPAGAVSPTTVTTDTPWMHSPMIRLRTHLGDGLDWPEAKAKAGSYAEQLATGDVGAAAREGADQAAAVLEDEIDGPVAWQKIPAASCCQWCQRVSGQLYHSAGSVAMHLDDHCGFGPITRATPKFGSFSNSRTIFGPRTGRPSRPR